MRFLLALLLLSGCARADDCGAALEVVLHTPDGEAPVRVEGAAVQGGREIKLFCESEPGSNFMIDCSALRVPGVKPGESVSVALTAGELRYAGPLSPSWTQVSPGCFEGRAEVRLQP